MKDSEVVIGKTYVAKVSGRLVPVKLLSVRPAGGWEAINLQTGRKIPVKMAAKLRREWVDGIIDTAARSPAAYSYLQTKHGA